MASMSKDIEELNTPVYLTEFENIVKIDQGH